MTGRATPDEFRAVPLFAALDEATLEEFAARLLVREHDANDGVFDEGESSGSVFVVLSGSVELARRDSDGKSWLIATRGPGEWFGEVGLIGVKRRGVSARATGPSRLLELHARELHELSRRDMKAYALLTMNLARELARKLDGLEQQLVEERGRHAASGITRSG